MPAASDRSFGYDALQRLTSGGTVALPETYSYDAEGNRLVSHLSAAHLTDARNRLLQDDQFDYTYDDNGNVATKTDRVMDRDARAGMGGVAADSLVQLTAYPVDADRYRGPLVTMDLGTFEIGERLAQASARYIEIAARQQNVGVIGVQRQRPLQHNFGLVVVANARQHVRVALQHVGD